MMLINKSKALVIADIISPSPISRHVQVAEMVITKLVVIDILISS